MRFIICFILLVSIVPVAELSAGGRGGNASGLQAQARARGVFRLAQQRRPRPDSRSGRRGREPMSPRLLERLRRLPPEEQDRINRNDFSTIPSRYRKLVEEYTTRRAKREAEREKDDE